MAGYWANFVIRLTQISCWVTNNRTIDKFEHNAKQNALAYSCFAATAELLISQTQYYRGSFSFKILNEASKNTFSDTWWPAASGVVMMRWNVESAFKAFELIWCIFSLWSSEYISHMCAGNNQRIRLSGARIAQWIAYLLHTQRPRVRILAFPKFFPRIFSMWTVARLIDSTAA